MFGELKWANGGRKVKNKFASGIREKYQCEESAHYHNEQILCLIK